MSKFLFSISFVLLFCVSVFSQAKSLAVAQNEVKTFANSQNFSVVYDETKYATKAEVSFDILEPKTPLEKQFKEFSFNISTLFAIDGIDTKPARTTLCINTQSKQFYFSSNRNLTLSIDNEAINLGEADRSTEVKGRKIRENLCWEIDKEIIEDLARASNIEYKIGTIKGNINSAKFQNFKDYSKLLHIEKQTNQ